VMNVNRTVIHNTYVENVHVNVNASYSHTSFNGGAGGVPAHATPQEQQFEHENHIAPTPQQVQHVQTAHLDKANFASANGGHPAHVTAVTVNNYHNTTVNNTRSVANTNNSTHLNNTTVNRTNTNENRTNTNVTNGNHDTTANNRPAAQPAARPQPEARPQPQQAARPQPQAHPEAKPAPKSEERPAGREPRR